MQPKIDLTKAFAADYVMPKKPVLLEIKEATYLSISGVGAPGGPEFELCIGALYGMAYTIKMTRKFAGQQDYTVSKLEAQWMDNGSGCAFAGPKEQWKWKLLIRTPEFISPTEMQQAAEKLKLKGTAPKAQAVILEKFVEGKCVQMLHVGPYDCEANSVAEMKAFAEAKGLRLSGLHHEIYISDPRRVPPERLKTILRHPVSA